MVCPNCGANNSQAISNVHGKIKRRGLISTLINLLLIICTCGFWLIILFIRGGSKGKIKTETMFVCNECGNEFTAKQSHKALAQSRN